jgi:hypothetical protein
MTESEDLSSTAALDTQRNKRKLSQISMPDVSNTNVKLGSRSAVSSIPSTQDKHKKPNHVSDTSTASMKPLFSSSKPGVKQYTDAYMDDILSGKALGLIYPIPRNHGKHDISFPFHMKRSSGNESRSPERERRRSEEMGQQVVFQVHWRTQARVH